MDDLTGKVALVTGASRGIGRAIALALAGRGVAVAIGFHRQSAEAEAVVARIVEAGGRALAFGADLADAQQAITLPGRVAAQLGTIDILVNNAAISPIRPFAELTAEDWNQTLSTNLGGAFHLTQAALPDMRAQSWGRLIFLSSIAAQTGGVIGPHYAASKAGLLGLMHSYASLLAREGITSNAIAPALIETDMVRANPAVRPDMIPIGRLGREEEVADIALMLAGNGYMTGQTISPNGGWYMS